MTRSANVPNEAHQPYGWYFFRRSMVSPTGQSTGLPVRHRLRSSVRSWRTWHGCTPSRLRLSRWPHDDKHCRGLSWTGTDVSGQEDKSWAHPLCLQDKYGSLSQGEVLQYNKKIFNLYIHVHCVYDCRILVQSGSCCAWQTWGLMFLRQQLSTSWQNKKSGRRTEIGGQEDHTCINGIVYNKRVSQ